MNANVEREAKSDKPMILRPGKTKAEPYMRASSVSDLVKDTYGLNIWQQNRIGAVVARDEAIRNEWLKLDPDEKGTFYDFKALREKTIRKWQGGRSYNRGAGVAGTRFHSVTDKNDTDALFAVDDEFADDLAVYKKVIAEIGDVVASEAFVVNHEIGVGGTLDKLIALKIPNPDGEMGVHIADLKTGKVDKKELDFGIQMAVYANSYPYDPSREDRYAESWHAVNRKWGMVIHLPLGSNRAEIIWVDIAAAWEITKAAILIKETRKLNVIRGHFIDGPTLEDRIREAPSKRVLAQIYTDNRELWTPELKALAEARREELDD